MNHKNNHDKSTILTTLMSRNAILLFTLVIIALVFEFLTRNSENSFISVRSISTIFMQASVIGVLACGMSYIIILTHIDLSVGSALAFLGGVAAWLMAPRAAPVDPELAELGLAMSSAVPSGLGLPALLTFFIVLLLATLLWGGKGLLQSATGMPAFVITLAGMLGYRGLSYLIVKREIPVSDDCFIARIGTGYLDIRLGWILFAGIIVMAVIQTIQARRHKSPTWYIAFIPAIIIGGVVLFLQVNFTGSNEGARGIAYLTCLWGASALIMHYISQNTVFGRHIYAVGGNKEAAELCGIHVKRVNIIAFMFMGALVGLAALMYLGQQGTAESSAGNLAELDAIAACVIGGVSLMGGKGNILGVVLGALIMQFLTSGLYQCNVESGYQMLIKASVLIIVVALDHVLRKE